MGRSRTGAALGVAKALKGLLKVGYVKALRNRMPVADREEGLSGVVALLAIKWGLMSTRRGYEP